MKKRRKADIIKRNTEELLLVSARGYLEKGPMDRAGELLKKDISWNFFIKAAARNGLSHIFYDALRAIDSHASAVPADVLEILKKKYLSGAPRITSQHIETMKLLRLFSEEKITVTPLKGSVLSGRLYGDTTVRGASSDIDLLIEEKKKEAAGKILEGVGYTRIPNPPNWPDEAFMGQCVFSKAEKTFVDLHWKMGSVPLANNTMRELWDGMRPKEEGGINYYELKEEELLIYLSVHLVDSAYLSGMRHLFDIHSLLTRHGDALDWERVIEKARRWKLSNCVYTALVFSKTLFRSSIPRKVFIILRPTLLTRFLSKRLADADFVFRSDSRRRRFVDLFLRHMLFDLLEAGSLRDFVAIIFPPREIMGKKSYLGRFKGGIKKFTGWLWKG